MVNLFISLYPEKNPLRQLELVECLEINSTVFDNIFILAENDAEITFIPENIPTKAKIYRLPTNSRPTVKTYLNCINHVCDESDINVLANSDVYFKETIPDLPKNACYLLTRYDILKDGTIHFLNRKDSADAIVFKGVVKYPRYSDYFWGQPGADNRSCWEFKEIGYQVSNPSLSIKCYHLHHGEKSYNTDTAPRVQRPYHFLPPCELI